jgi:hypothetical protein
LHFIEIFQQISALVTAVLRSESTSIGWASTISARNLIVIRRRHFGPPNHLATEWPCEVIPFLTLLTPVRFFALLSVRGAILAEAAIWRISFSASGPMLSTARSHAIALASSVCGTGVTASTTAATTSIAFSMTPATAGRGSWCFCERASRRTGARHLRSGHRRPSARVRPTRTARHVFLFHRQPCCRRRQRPSCARALLTVMTRTDRRGQ